MDIFPARDWWLTPSGGKALPYKWYDYLEAPLVAHPLGAGVLFGILQPYAMPDFLLWWTGTLFMGWWQWNNWERLGWENYGPKTIVWRMILGMVPLAGLVWLI